MNNGIPIDQPVYIISVASQLTGLHPQTIRHYEKWGLIQSSRRGNMRFYSAAVIMRLRSIKYFTEQYGSGIADLRLFFAIKDVLASTESPAAKLAAIQKILEEKEK